MRSLERIMVASTAPVLLVVFNRPDLTRNALAKLAVAGVRRLYVSADGPRPDRPSDAALCAETRALFDRLDWDVELRTRFHDRNHGCRWGVNSAIDWVFEHEEAAIILEDDIDPTLDFFSFCHAMIERYRDDERIMMISGMNGVGEWQSRNESYHFSRYGGIWGWATWRRAWRLNDTTGEAWRNPKLHAAFRSVLPSKQTYMQLAGKIEASHSGAVEAWDFIWLYSRLAHGGLAVVPCVNLVDNLGFREDATHTRGGKSPLPAVGKLNTPLHDPVAVLVDESFDRALLRKRGWLAHEQWGLSALRSSYAVALGKKLIRSVTEWTRRARGFVAIGNKQDGG